MDHWLELFFRYDTWKILAGALLGVTAKTIWDHYVRRQRLADMVRREVRAQVSEYKDEAQRQCEEAPRHL